MQEHQSANSDGGRGEGIGGHQVREAREAGAEGERRCVQLQLARVRAHQCERRAARRIVSKVEEALRER